MRHFSFFLLALSLVACGSSGGDADESESDVTVHPGGPGGDVKLTLKVPDAVLTRKVDFSTPGSFIQAPTARFLTFSYHDGSQQDVKLDPNQAKRLRFQPDASGFAYITIAYDGPGGAFFRVEQPIKITAAETTIELGAYSVIRALPLGNGPFIDLDHYAPTESLTFDDPLRGQTVELSKEPGFLVEPIFPAFPGHYTWSVSTTTPATAPDLTGFDVKAGAVAEPHVTVSHQFASALFEKAANPGYPDAVEAPPLHVSCANATSAGNSDVAWNSSVSVNTSSHAQCTWGYGAVTAPFELDPEHFVRIQGKRIDVDDVTLTDEAPGTVVGGFYTLTAKVGSEVVTIVDSAPTKTGIDVPPGSYHLRIRYKSLAGTARTTEQDLTVD